MYGCALRITYNTSLLDALQIVRGDFFPEEAYFTFVINESHGVISVNVSLHESHESLWGNGTLTRITFSVAQAPTVCTSSVLKLDQTQLHDSDGVPINHNFVSAIYFWRSLLPDPPIGGRLIDLYSQKGGEGPDTSAGNFLLDELVTLYANASYDDWPQQNALVAYQAIAPDGRTVLIGVVETDEQGFAEISFRIPNLPSNVGFWSIVATVDIACEVVWDTLRFYVQRPPVVGGISFPIRIGALRNPLTLHLALVVLLTTVFALIKRETPRRRGPRPHTM